MDFNQDGDFSDSGEMITSQAATTGNTAAAKDAPDRVTASASPREASKRLLTALVQTMACTSMVASAMPNHSPTQFNQVPVAVLSRDSATVNDREAKVRE